MLGEDEGAFRAWSRLRGRAALRDALEAAEVIASYMARAAADASVPGPRAHGQSATPGPARLLVPLLPDGTDPGEATRPAQTIGMLRLDAGDFGPAVDFQRPFAYWAGGASLGRVPDINVTGTAVVLTRRALPIHPGEVHAVRLGSGVVLARILWNGTELLLLPAPGATDFVVVPAPDAGALAGLVAGRVVLARVPAPGA